MSADELWLAATWPFVSASMPPAPATVLEIGCGPLGGFVPQLLGRGYAAVGVDPRAPEAQPYRRTPFEQYEAPCPFDVVVASTSLHHVADVDDVVGRIADVLTPQGLVIVVEWAWQRMDEATARWCFGRLAQTPEPSWLGNRSDEWAASGQPWDVYLPAWSKRQGLHDSDGILRALERRFAPHVQAAAPYYFPDLRATSESDEQAAIDSGIMQATAVRYVGRLR